jgi:hypothetical protein
VELLVNIAVLNTVRVFGRRTPKKIIIFETVWGGGDKRRLKQTALYGASGILLLA